GRWANGRGKARAPASARAKSFRFTKAFTSGCWRNRRSGQELFGMRQNRKVELDLRADAVAALNHHPCGVTIEDAKAFGDVGHPDSSSAHAIRLQRSRGFHSHAVVFHLDHQS